MKNHSRTENSIFNIAGGALFRVIGMFCPFIIRTIIIQVLGVQYLGLNSLFSSILTVLSLSDLGIGGALGYQMYQPIAEGDKNRVCALLKIYRDCYRIIGLIILVLGFVLVPFLPYLVSGDFPSDINMYALYFIYLANTVLSYFLFAYKKSLLDANQKTGIESLIASATSTVMYIAQIIALFFVRNYYAYAVIIPLSTLLLNIIRSVIVGRLYPEYVCKGTVEKGFVKKLCIKVRALVGHKIGTTIITSSDSIVVSSILGLSVLGEYGNYHQIVASLISLIGVIYSSITASIGNSLIKLDKKHVEKNFNTLTLLNSWLVGWCSVCLLVLFQPFMKVWMGEELLLSNTTMVMFVIYFYSWLVRRIGLTYKDAAGMWEQDFWKPYVGSIANLVLNIALCKIIGVAGVVIATIFVMTCIYFPWETVTLYKYLFKHSCRKYVFRMAYYFIVTFVACIITWYIGNLITVNGWKELIYKGILCVFVPNIIFIISYSKLEEFADAKIRLLDLLKKR